METFLSRKFIFALLILGLCYTLVLFGKLSGDSFANFAKWIAGLYFAGNVGATVANNMGGADNNKERS